MPTIEEIVRGVVGGEESVASLAARHLELAENGDDRLAAFTHVEPDAVMAEANELDRRLAAGEAVGALAGIPIAVKDLIDVKGLRTSYGGNAFEPYVAERDAHAVARLRRAGAVILGKTRTSEFAWGATTPPTRNPLKPEWVAGGSSGGSGAAVGAGFVPAALGTDTGGSVRIPAAVCGVVGYKPTFGLVGRTGVLPGNPWFDHVGPLTRSVADARIVASVLAGPDPDDAATRRVPARRIGGLADARPSSNAAPALAGVRVGTLDDALFEFVDGAMKETFAAALGRLEEAGASLVPVQIPELRYVEATLLAADLPASAGLNSNCIRASGPRIEPSIRALMELAHEIPAVLVARAHQVRRMIIAAVSETFRRCELELFAVPGMTAPRIGHDQADLSFTRASGEKESVLAAYVRPHALASVTGQPAIVLPIGDPADPMSLQLIGKPFADPSLLSIAERIEVRLADLSGRPGRLSVGESGASR
jgi:aspartyl-tRNA(Asn)/glutamyl-tRNA(Gln) amidotransferase subunit A